MVSDILYKEGITKIDAAFETLMDGANNLEETLKWVLILQLEKIQSHSLTELFFLRLFDNYMIELQTNARQYLTPHRVMEYLEQLKNKKEYEKCSAFFIYVIATR